MPESRRAAGRLRKLRKIFTKPQYTAVFIIAILVYYSLFYYIITKSNYGLFLVSAPIYAVYLLTLTSGILATISAYVIASRLKYSEALEYGASGSITLLAGGVIASCACQVPIFVSLLYILGASVADVTLVTFYIASYQIYIIAALILANMALVYHYLGKIS